MQIVRKILCNGMLFENELKSFDKWHKEVTGTMERQAAASSVHDTRLGQRKEHLLPVELQYHYSQYCYYVKSQRRVLASDDLKDWLLTAFQAFQNLEEIYFITEVTNVTLPSRTWDGNTDFLSSVGRETLFEPMISPSSDQGKHILLSLFSAARESHAKMKSISCDWIPCRALDSIESGIRSTDEILGRIRFLKLRVDIDDFRRGQDCGEHTCAKFISKAMMLRTLHLEIRAGEPSATLLLIHFLEYREHWPSLKDLRLGGFFTDWKTLRELLITHANNLCSLELSSIFIVAGQAPLAAGSESCSWVSVIQFLRKSLQLSYVRLDGQLSAPGEEWWIRDDSQHQGLGELIINDDRESAEECLRDRIHQYILKGGEECPLRPPGTNGSENRGDYSWKVYP